MSEAKYVPLTPVTNSEVEWFLKLYDDPNLILTARHRCGGDISRQRYYIVGFLLEKFLEGRALPLPSPAASPLTPDSIASLAEFLRRPEALTVISRILVAQKDEEARAERPQ
jgi:hypothetical protein